jgi:hypothetical protein
MEGQAKGTGNPLSCPLLCEEVELMTPTRVSIERQDLDLVVQIDGAPVFTVHHHPLHDNVAQFQIACALAAQFLGWTPCEEDMRGAEFIERAILH